MANKPSYDIDKLLKMAANKTPKELLESLSPEQSAQIKSIMKDKSMTEKIMKSKQAQDLLNKIKGSQ
ncbi:MAG: hypothetical protein K2I60_01300 [Oscillospiraceae bacterium]|nr:hypothetical protein [Oscillospiraceae bacterium]MDE5852753.1 hypothetical protein [Oscillospiraceae bacterium]